MTRNALTDILYEGEVFYITSLLYSDLLYCTLLYFAVVYTHSSKSSRSSPSLCPPVSEVCHPRHPPPTHTLSHITFPYHYPPSVMSTSGDCRCVVCLCMSMYVEDLLGLILWRMQDGCIER